MAGGWFVLNARDGRWLHREGRGKRLKFEGDAPFPQLGVSLYVLGPGEPIGMYHWEADQEDFLVLSGEALLLVEGEERALRQWDFVHCPAGTNHMIVGAGSGRCVVLAVGAREHQDGPGWGGYTVDPVALGHGAGVESETTDVAEAYARFAAPEPAAYEDGWLPVD
jgi:quercetin dioxygenase-like cupin family protein